MKLENIEKNKSLMYRLKDVDNDILEANNLRQIICGYQFSMNSCVIEISEDCLSRVKEIILSDLNEQREKVIKEIEKLD